MKLGMPSMEGMGTSLTQMESGLNFLARKSRSRSSSMAAPARATLFNGQSLPPQLQS